MKRLKAEYIILGDGCAALFAAAKLLETGATVILVNPQEDFSINDIRCRDGLALWRAAFRSPDSAVTLPNLWDRLSLRLRESLPISLEESGITRCEHWSIFSSTPIHQNATSLWEQEYFRLERKDWSAGHVRLVNPDYADVRFRNYLMRLSRVAAVEGAMVRQHGLSWNAPMIGRVLSEFIFQKSQIEGQSHFVQILKGVRVTKREGRRLNLVQASEDITVDYEKALLVFLTGDIVPEIKNLTNPLSEPWIQSLRKKRREQHFAWFARRPGLQQIEKKHFAYSVL